MQRGAKPNLDWCKDLGFYYIRFQFSQQVRVTAWGEKEKFFRVASLTFDFKKKVYKILHYSQVKNHLN